MTKLKLLGAAAVVLSSALASPVMAQQVITNPGKCAQFYPNANCQNTGPGNPYTGDYQRRSAYRTSQNDWNNNGWNNNGWNNGWHDSWNDNGWNRRHDSGFAPGDVAAGVVGGAAATADAAVGTAGAIATAPFHRDSYAYYNNGYNNGWDNNGWNNQTYAQRNGFVCQPGTWFKGEDGRRHPCQ
ncbi:hypothetical protein [Bradyrhizobium canariense]|uniref:Lectin-like protein BA14k n=1 Tax=Bradyrhizobium canariense TaxID=255045 RepID=A0A1H1NA88_9BRAD|nr:hypothetical protein [Bradyrhizobium canariense]SDR95828.1 hypothetical protein SAMN05444158_0543 [Bradyrhizobium canariense]